MAVSRDGSTLALGGNDGSLMVVAAETLADPQLLTTDRSAVSALDWGKTREFLAAGNTGGALAVWSKGTSQEPDNFAVPGQAFDKTVWRVKWSPTAGLLAYTSHSGMIGLIDTADGSQRELSALKDYALGLAWSPDGNALAVGSTDGRIRMWNLLSESTEMLFPAEGSDGHVDSIGGLAFSPEGRLLASCGNDGSVVLWEVSSRMPRARSTPAGCYLEDVCFDSEGRFVAAVGADGYLRVWSGPEMAPWFAVKDSDKHLWAVSWNQDSLFLAGTDGRVTVIDTRENVWQNRAHAIVGHNVGP
jgi:WD40 repeat protein